MRILAVVERDAEKSGWPSESTSKEDLIKQADRAGYKLVRIETFLSEDNIYFFIRHAQPVSIVFFST